MCMELVIYNMYVDFTCTMHKFYVMRVCVGCANACVNMARIFKRTVFASTCLSVAVALAYSRYRVTLCDATCIPAHLTLSVPMGVSMGSSDTVCSNGRFHGLI